MQGLDQIEAEAYAELIAAIKKFLEVHQRVIEERLRMQKPLEKEPAPKPPSPTQPQRTSLLTRREAAEFLNLRPQTLAVWHVTGQYSLPVVKVGRAVRYRRADLERWLAQRTVPGPGQ